jgi:hypothetical protein
VSINRGGNPPSFEYIGQIWNKMDFAPQDRIRLGDIDGDGRIDVCAIITDGDLCTPSIVFSSLISVSFHHVWMLIFFYRLLA